jgi:N-alpha-acetyltransferase 40
MSSCNHPLSASTAETTDPRSLGTNKRPRRGEVVRSKAERKSLVERVNGLSIEEFSQRYFPYQEAKAIESSTGFKITLTDWAGMRAGLRVACMDLIELTSAGHYKASEMGWSRSKKMKEMRHPAMRYMLLCQSQGHKEAETGGFLAFMITEEDGYEIIYCYELHLQPRMQGMGTGKGLMELMEMIGAKVMVEKAMLTVFRSNERAVKAYQKWGYRPDQFSPEPRRLRDGTVKELTYIILSKRTDSSYSGVTDPEPTVACEVPDVMEK